MADFDMDSVLKRVKEFKEKYGSIGRSASKKKNEDEDQKKKRIRGLMNQNQRKLPEQIEGEY